MPIATNFFYALVIMNLLFVSTAWCLARPSLRASAVVVVVAVMWALCNGPIEGHILISVNLEHGVTESDLLSVAAVLIAAVSAWRVRRR
ncbi:MAG: hypothetical protein JHC79_12650 [Williamsia sp.]|nr:hypothetical protein [Williamsia sp.]MBJ7289760.1 hypothetical protein [Williamsia sp.]